MKTFNSFMSSILIGESVDTAKLDYITLPSNGIVSNKEVKIGFFVETVPSLNLMSYLSKFTFKKVELELKTSEWDYETFGLRFIVTPSPNSSSFVVVVWPGKYVHNPMMRWLDAAKREKNLPNIEYTDLINRAYRDVIQEKDPVLFFPGVYSDKKIKTNLPITNINRIGDFLDKIGVSESDILYS